MWNTRHFRTNPPHKEKSNFRKGGGFLLVHFSILENLPGFYSFQNPRAKFGRAFIKFRFWPTQPKVGSHFWSTQICCFPLRNPIFGSPKPQNFLARFARGLLFIPKIFARFARGFLFFPIFSKFSRGLLFFQFSIFKKPFGLSGLLLKGGVLFGSVWY